MVNSGKNNPDTETDEPLGDDEITDVLLMDKDEMPVPKTEKVDEVIYELVVEDQNDGDAPSGAADSAAAGSDLDEKIKELQLAHESMKQQLEKAVATSDKLGRQLKRERRHKRASVTSYVGLTMGGLALIIGTAAALFAGNLQREVNALTDSVTALENHKHIAADAPLDAEGINARIDELTANFDKILAEQGNMDKALLEATSVLKTQLDEIASQNITVTPAAKKPAVSLKSAASSKTKAAEKSATATTESKSISLKKSPKAADTDDKSAASKKMAASKPAAKKSPALTNLVVKRDKDGNAVKASPKTKTKAAATAATGDKPATESSSASKDWVVGLGSYKDEATANAKAKEYRTAGVPAAVIKVKANGEIWHRVSTRPFASKKEAQDYSEQVKSKLKIKSTLVTKH